MSRRGTGRGASARGYRQCFTSRAVRGTATRRPLVRTGRVRSAAILCLVVAAAALACGLAVGVTVSAGQTAADANPTTSVAPPDARLASRQAFRNESSSQALATARDKFPWLVNAPALKWPATGVVAALKGYLNPETAVVDSGAGRRGLLESSIPLRGTTPDGSDAPIDLNLIDAGGSAYAPRSAATAVRIPASSQDELRFPDRSFGVSLGGAAARPATISQNKAFFANVVPDGDLVLEPRPQGAELSVVLRSPAAPSEIPLRFDLAAGQQLQLADRTGADPLPAGSVEVVEGAKRVAAIYPASAADADGSAVPVSYKLDGDRLLIEVDTSGDLAWPLVVDPPIGVYDNNGTSAGSGTTGYTWPNWAPATYLEQANTTSSSWSYCNNQASNPNKQFYFCQGSLTGSAGAGGPLYIKPNAGQNFAAGNWGQWVKQARIQDPITGTSYAYIYRVDATALSNVGAQHAQLAVGVRKADASGWENGTVTTGGDGVPNSLSGVAAYQTPINQVLVGATRYLSVEGGQPTQSPPNSPITPGNRAVLRLVMQNGLPGSPLPYVAMGGAATYSSEVYAPTLDPPTHSVAPDANHWVSGYTDTVSTTARDKGLGMGTISFSQAGAPASTVASNCLTDPGPGTTTKNSYDGCAFTLAMPGQTYTAPEGVSTYTLTAQDLVGNQNHANDQTWTVKVDGVEPTIHSSGELDMAELTPRISSDQPNLHINATDEPDAGEVTSGVQNIKVQIDGADPSTAHNYASSNVASQSGPCNGCSLDHDFQIDTSSYADGSHTVDVWVTDFAGNQAHETWSFNIDRTTPKPYCSDTSADPNDCQPDPPQTSPPPCSATPALTATSGTVVSSAQAVSTTQQTNSVAVAPSDTVPIENLTVAPAVSGFPQPFTGYSGTGSLVSANIGAAVPSVAVGSVDQSACIAPTSIMAGAQPPQVVNGTALEYADTSPSTDTILRPTPLGVQDMQQIRDASAPETQTYQVALQGNQYLQKLDNGSIAVIDPSLPATPSGDPPPGTTTTSDAPDPDTTGQDTSPGAGNDGAGPIDYQPADLSGLTPDEADIAPSSTQFQYESESRWVDLGASDVSGQAVAIITSPAARDAAGTGVPASSQVTGPNTFSIVTQHQEATYQYPVLATAKVTTTSNHHKHPFTYGWASGKAVGFSANDGPVTNPPNPNTNGTDRVRRALHMPYRTTGDLKHPPTARFVMYYQNSCNTYDSTLDNPANPPPPDPEHLPPLPPNASDAQKNDHDRCEAAARAVRQALDEKLTPYVSLEPDPGACASRGKKAARSYARSIWRLERYGVFSNVKFWGPTNEPDYASGTCSGDPKLAADFAARIWEELKQKNRDGGCPRCVLAAGEFSHDTTRGSADGKIKANDAYITQYIKFLTDRGDNVHVFALHDYYDVWFKDSARFEPPGYAKPSKQYAQVRFFGKERVHANYPHARLWLSENGVQLGGTGVGQDLRSGGGPAQRAAAKRFLEIGNEDPRVDLVLYYSFFGCGPHRFNCRGSWDSALVRNPPDPPPNPYDGQSPPYTFGQEDPSQPAFRATYCVLTGLASSKCYQGTGF